MTLGGVQRWLVVIGAILASIAPVRSASISEAEALQPPSPARLSAVLTAARREGWGPQRAALRDAARRAYQQDKLAAAESWLHVYQWATLFAQTEAEFVPRWVQAVNAANVGHANMPRSLPTRSVPLGLAVAPELQAWLIGNADFSRDFFSLVSPVDYLPRTFAIFDELFRREPEQFKTYSQLALALAVVDDVPPPPFWPHAQVSPDALPRRWPAVTEAFAWWIRQDQQRRTVHRLTRLGAEELKFVVDAAAPFSELEWAQRVSEFPSDQLPRAYNAVRYRMDRLKANQPVWPGRSYALADILATGGICADQAYFATQVGKARGIPTLLFSGAGNDARHAWFGYFDRNQHWQLEAGRYAEQRFVTGLARDPQTWREFSDHELQFLTERFRSLPSYRQSRAHEEFAAELLAGRDAAAAAIAARKAVNYERRNQPAWELLIAATQQQKHEAKAVEAVLREAALVFRNYPDLEALYISRVIESLRARGQTSAADEEQRQLARRNQGKRTDISVAQARDMVLRAMATQPLAEQIRTYNSVVDSFGPGAGIGLFDEVVTVFVEHLLQLQQKAEAQRASDRAQRVLKVEPRSQLEKEFTKLSKTIAEAR